MDYNDYQQEAYDDGYRDALADYDNGEYAYPLEERDAYRHGYQVGLEESGS
jgi:hypothetical protein